MEAGFNLIRTKFDKLLLTIIGWFFLELFFTWSIANIIKTNNIFIWLITLPISLMLSIFLYRDVKVEESSTKKDVSGYKIVFLVLLIFTIFYYLEPILRFPNSTIGIPNKDLHDGISVFIADNGYPPLDTPDFAKNLYILSSQNGLYLGYPNVLHTFSALLIRLGSNIFQATWIAMLIGLIITSISIFLLARLVYDDIFSAILSGLFAVSSLRIPITSVASIPMMFSILLLLPGILIFIVHSGLIINSRVKYVIPAVAVSLITVSYGGTIMLFLGILTFLLLIKIIFNKKNQGLNLLKLIIFSAPLAGFCLFFVKRIYWQNSFPTTKDFDPFELSQRFLPLDKPIYMIFLAISLFIGLYVFIKNRQVKTERVYLLFFLGLSVLFILPTAYYFIFHLINKSNGLGVLTNINPAGFFGGLNYQKVMRIALVQPYFFIFMLGYCISKIKKPWGYIVLTGVLLSSLVLKYDLPIYQSTTSEIRDSFYNKNDSKLPLTFLSDLRLIINNQIWGEDGIYPALDEIKNQTTNNILLWDERLWTEETIANWGSIYSRKRITRPYELGITEFKMDYPTINLLKNKQMTLLMIQPSRSNLTQIRSIFGVEKIYSNKDVYLYRLP